MTQDPKSQMITLQLPSQLYFVAAVNGNWGRWTTSSSCTVTCGQGRQTRVRSCNDPAPLNGGLSCIISSNGQRANREEITVQCIQADCPGIYNI